MIDNEPRLIELLRQIEAGGSVDAFIREYAIHWTNRKRSGGPIELSSGELSSLYTWVYKCVKESGETQHAAAHVAGVLGLHVYSDCVAELVQAAQLNEKIDVLIDAVENATLASYQISFRRDHKADDALSKARQDLVDFIESYKLGSGIS